MTFLPRPGTSRPSDNYMGVAWVGLGLIGVTFGIFGLWAAFAPLSSAVVGHGILVVDSNRQTIQHLEGGIVRKILIHEGDHVAKGQVLFELDPLQADASRDIAKNQLYALLAKEARLEAERGDRASLSLPPDLVAAGSDPTARQAIDDETREFQERRATLQAQNAVLQNRIEQYKTEIQGIDQERASSQTQVGYLQDEISGLKKLYDEDLVPKPRLLAVESQLSQLQGQLGRLVADRAKAQEAIGETTLQMHQLRQQFLSDASKEMADVETQIGDIRQRYVVAQDAAHRVNITAPMSGTVQNLRVFTDGAVVRQAEPLVDIAPDKGQMQIEAHFSPLDVDSVYKGQDVQVRFSSFHSRTIPVISGTVRSVSQDRLVDEATHQPYYMAIVKVDDQKLPDELQGKLRAGLPVDVMARTGSRTMLQYLFEPLFDALHKSMRER